MAYVSVAADVSVVIVSYNTRSLLEKCIGLVDRECEIIVVDNGSTDGSREMLQALPYVRSLFNQENRGFGAANNQGLELSTRPLVLLLNSDAFTTQGAVASLASVFASEQVIAAGGMLLNPDNSLQESCANRLTLWAVFCEQFWLEKLFRKSQFFSPYWMSRRLAGCSSPQPVAQVMGACLMMRKLEKFDERFFLYCEDTELCLRLDRRGKILYVPDAKFYHRLGSSSETMRPKAVAFYNCGKELYFRIHGGLFPAYICFLLNRIGALFRFVYWGLLWLGGAGMKGRGQRAIGFLQVLFAPVSYDGVRNRRWGSGKSSS